VLYRRLTVLGQANKQKFYWFLMGAPRTETVSFPLIFQLGTTIGSIIHTQPEMINREGRGTTELKQIFSNQPISGQVNPPKAGE
jgi:hypothetical protein